MSSKQSRSVPTRECQFEKMEEIEEQKVKLNIAPQVASHYPQNSWRSLLTKSRIILIVTVLVIAVIICGTFANSFVCTDPEIVTRDEWGAKPPTDVENLTLPVPYVVIHHSYIPAACSTKEECINDMQWMQKYHQQNNSWCDIGYNFAVGGDNRIYVGRGWTAVGAHAPRYNSRSIGIVLIGDWTDILPPESQMLAAKQLINMGIRDGYISENYKLIGHRQVRETACPGEALYKEIQMWPHWIPNPDEEVIPVVPLDKEDLKPDPREDPDASLASEDNEIKRHSSTDKDESTSRSIKHT